TLQTIAMVLAELVAGDQLGLGQEAGRPPTALGSMRIEAMRLSDGIAMGRAVLHQPRITIRQMVAENIDAEINRLDTAVVDMQLPVDYMVTRAAFAEGGEQQETLEPSRMFARDRGWLERITEAIRSGLTAEAAVQKVQEDTRARMSQIADPYLRDR